MRRTSLFAVAAVLSLVTVCRSADQPATKPTSEQLDKAVETRLQARVNKVEFDDIPFKDVVQFLRDVSGLSIYIKWTSLSLAGIEKTAPINVHLTNVSLAKVLRIILDDAGKTDTPLDYEVEEGVITISTRHDLSMRTRTRVIDVSDLVADPPMVSSLAELELHAAQDFLPCAPAPAGPQIGTPFEEKAPPEPAQPGGPGSKPATQPAAVQEEDEGFLPEEQRRTLGSLVDVIMAVADVPWRRQGGEFGSIQQVGTTLIVNQSANNQRRIDAVLDKLRQAKAERTVKLGLAILRPGKPGELGNLRQGLAQAGGGVEAFLRGGADKDRWTLERCDVGAYALGEAIRCRRIQQSVPSGEAGLLLGPARTGYSLAVVAASREKDDLLVVVPAASAWRPSGLADPKAAQSAVVSSNTYRLRLRGQAAEMIELTPAEAKEGPAVLVIWQAQKKGT